MNNEPQAQPEPQPEPQPKLYGRFKDEAELQQFIQESDRLRIEQEVKKQMEQKHEPEPIPRYTPTDKDIEALMLGGDEAVKTMSHIAENITSQAVQMAERKILEQLSPYATVLQELYQEAVYDKFFRENEDLKDYRDVVDTIAAAMHAQGKTKGMKQDQINKIVAAEVRKFVAAAPAKAKATVPEKGGRASTPVDERTKLRDLLFPRN